MKSQEKDVWVPWWVAWPILGLWAWLLIHIANAEHGAPSAPGLLDTVGTFIAGFLFIGLVAAGMTSLIMLVFALLTGQ